DGSYRYVSSASRELLGYNPAELVGSSPYELIHPDDIERIAVAHESALGAAPYTVTYRMRRKTGEYVWIETTTRALRDDEPGPVAHILGSPRPIEGRSTIEEITASEHTAWLHRIQDVLATEAIGIVFQPILELETGRVVGCEALSRFPGADPSLTPDLW